MAKDKDKQQNPATAELKKQKQAALKKSKANLATQRNEKLARRNPERIQRQVDDLKQLEIAQGGNLRPRDKQQLEQLERDVKAVRKAREVAPGAGRSDDREEGGDRSSRGGRGGFSDRGREGRGGTSLGKRRWGSEVADASASEDTDPEVRDIPMPRDTPPPVPRRPRKQYQDQDRGQRGNPNNIAIDKPRLDLPQKPQVKPVAQTTYSAEPQIRNLRQEAISKFVPAAVAARLKQRQAMRGGGGDGRLLEPEEVEKLEKDGYLDAKNAATEAAKEEAYTRIAQDGGPGGTGSLAEEEAAFERELADVDMVEKGAGDLHAAASTAREDLAADVRKDATEAARGTAEETEHIANVESAGGAPADAAKEGNTEARRAHTQLRLVEVEDVSEDEW